LSPEDLPVRSTQLMMCFVCGSNAARWSVNMRIRPNVWLAQQMQGSASRPELKAIPKGLRVLPDPCLDIYAHFLAADDSDAWT
jgi:hypothetical protein